MNPLATARVRLEFFVRHGLLAEVPSAWQIAVGALVMLPVVLQETPGKRAVNRRTLLGQIPIRVPLQVLYCPQQAIVGTGLLARRETVIRHALSVFHEDAPLTYDLQLLQTHPGGLDALEARARDVAAGRGVGARVLRGLVGGRGYHERLADLAAAARRFDYPAPAGDPRFGSVVGFAQYCLTLPRWPALGHYGFDWKTLSSARPLDQRRSAP